MSEPHTTPTVTDEPPASGLAGVLLGAIESGQVSGWRASLSRFLLGQGQAAKAVPPGGAPKRWPLALVGLLVVWLEGSITGGMDNGRVGEILRFATAARECPRNAPTVPLGRLIRIDSPTGRQSALVLELGLVGVQGPIYLPAGEPVVLRDCGKDAVVCLGESELCFRVDLNQAQ